MLHKRTLLGSLLFPGRLTSNGVRRYTSELEKAEKAAREDQLDLLMASKILLSPPSKPKKFGFDFHLVQFFFACMPSLAVFLVAQYARYDIRKMEAELEEKKQLEEQEALSHSPNPDAKDDFEGITGNNTARSSSDGSSKDKEEILIELRQRIDALENMVKKLTNSESPKVSSDLRTEHKVDPAKQPAHGKIGSIENGDSSSQSTGSKNNQVSEMVKNLTNLESGNVSRDVKIEHKINSPG